MFFCGIELEQLECISYLGVLLNEDLKWSKRVNTTAYTAVDRPKLEYACAAWDLYLQKDIASFERIQRKAARHSSPYNTLLSKVSSTSLFNKRIQNFLILLYKSLFSLIFLLI